MEDRSALPANVKYGYGLGWSFTPLAGKRPTLDAWQKRPRETLEQALAWAQRQNVGIRTGAASGIVGIDVDPGGDITPLNLPATVAVSTGRKGAFHLYFRCRVPIGNSSGKLGPHIDVKGDGGQLVYPGSVHPDTGAVYQWGDGHEPWHVEIAELPGHIIKLLADATPPKRPLPGNVPAKPDRYGAKALAEEAQAVRQAAEGQRNDTLHKSAVKLGTLVAAGYLTRQQVQNALAAAVEDAGWDYDDTGRRQTAKTIASGLEFGLQHPRQVESREPPKPTRHPTHILTPGPHVDDKTTYTEQSTAMFAGAALAQLPEDLIYRKDFIPGEILGPAGKRKWVEFGENRMRIVVDGHVKLGKWVTSKKNGTQVLLYQACNKDNAGLVIAHAQQAPHIRELSLMVPYPVYGPGFVRVAPGWHDGLYYDEPEELRDLKPITDCEIIHNVLYDLVVDFPFKTEADKQNFLGLLITPIVAPALEGNRPMHLVNSPLERTGKSKLVNEVFGGIILGRELASMQITEHEEEREKRIVAMLLQGESLMHLDNLPEYIDSASLASLLTSHFLASRILGYSRTVKLRNNLVIVGTGNNVRASGEITKRVVPIMLEPRSANPEGRRDFCHPDLRRFIRENRRDVLECLLGMIDNWVAAGRPKSPVRLGGFESWSETIGGILRVNAMVKWRTNETDWRTAADPKGAEMLAFVEAWHQAYDLQPVDAASLRSLAQQQDLFGGIFARGTAPAASVAFGRMLSRQVDRPVGGWYIRRSGPSNHARYALEVVK